MKQPDPNPLFASMDVLFTSKEVRGYQLFGFVVVWEKRERIYL